MRLGGTTMTREIRKDLNKARKLYKSGKKQEAFEIYERHYSENPEVFDHWDKVRLCWCIYYLYIRDSKDETEIMEYAEMVTGIVRQDDLNKSPVCVYTQCIFKVLMVLKSNEDWEFMLYWLDKLNPDLLNEEQNESGGIVYPSKKEEYYFLASKAYLACQDFEECIEISKEALDKVTVDFAFDGDVWHYRRIAKSLYGLGQYDDALTYFEKVVKVKRDWYILKEIAQTYYEINEFDDALKYAVEAILSNNPLEIKVNVFYLIYNILKDENGPLALKIESGSIVPDEIEDLGIDESELDIPVLESEIRKYWTDRKYEGRELQFGTITKVFDHGKSGFITSDDEQSFYFTASEFKDEGIFMKEGQYVSFYTEKAFDKSKNRESVNAVNIKMGD